VTNRRKGTKSRTTGKGVYGAQTKETRYTLLIVQNTPLTPAPVHDSPLGELAWTGIIKGNARGPEIKSKTKITTERCWLDFYQNSSNLLKSLKTTTLYDVSKW